MKKKQLRSASLVVQGYWLKGKQVGDDRRGFAESNKIYRKTSILPPWRSIFQPFPHSGVLLEVTFN